MEEVFLQWVQFPPSLSRGDEPVVFFIFIILHPFGIIIGK
jgi:hypothetical protein